MRISLFLLFVCVFQLMAEEADAQNAEIKLSQNSMTIKQLVKEIEAQTDYLVVFRDQDVDVNKTVSFNTKTATVADYLEMITKTQVLVISLKITILRYCLPLLNL